MLSMINNLIQTLVQKERAYIRVVLDKGREFLQELNQILKLQQVPGINVGEQSRHRDIRQLVLDIVVLFSIKYSRKQYNSNLVHKGTEMFSHLLESQAVRQSFCPNKTSDRSKRRGSTSFLLDCRIRLWEFEQTKQVECYSAIKRNCLEVYQSWVFPVSSRPSISTISPNGMPFIRIVSNSGEQVVMLFVKCYSFEKASSSQMYTLKTSMSVLPSIVLVVSPNEQRITKWQSIKTAYVSLVLLSMLQSPQRTCTLIKNVTQGEECTLCDLLCRNVLQIFDGQESFLLKCVYWNRILLAHH